MNLNSIFEKKVDRPIEGVIKADDEASLRVEFEEYVITNEIAQRLESFLDAYNSYTTSNGAWISGFFGSGKSHLLKLLAYVLENRTIDGSPALELFLPKCGDNEILRGSLKKALSIPSKSILFNIDQKADVISKKQIDALLAVFVKVFDEACGYYGKQGHIAKFERDLDGRNQLTDFKTRYEAISGLPWESGREQAVLESDNIATAYSQTASVPKETVIGILDKYRNEYKVSIEDFAEQVNGFIERQPPGFRLNFFVDEVGQYIADNIKLMTNLQTIAESLATKCKGRAWILVTAQEDMSTVIGQMDKQQANDFSKIQARFNIRMKLTSTNVEEVIQKRLLKKREQSIPELSDLYRNHQNDFKTLFDFADGSRTYRNFIDRDHFIHSYPFVPYQFGLFQASIENLSTHNAFEGRHSSVGERSMLGVFQQVAIAISKLEVGKLATFDLMFEGIRTALLAQIQRSILQAEQHLGDRFAEKVLKALFLVKYVKDFKPTIRNITILMLEDLNQDLPALRKRVEAALNLLDQQTYIQRNGDLYEFLTNEEKDIEQEIKNTDVENSDVAEELCKMIFDGTVKQRKIRYTQINQDYAFARKLDDKLYGREAELTVHVISPFHEHSSNESIVRAQSMGRDEIVVLMPSDDRLMLDLLMYKKTEKFVAQNVITAQQESTKKIIEQKRTQNQERYSSLLLQVSKALGKAKIIIRGETIDIATEDPQQRLYQGFHELIGKVYPNLSMLRGASYTETDIAKLIESGQGILGADSHALSESEQEMISFILNNDKNNLRTSVKTLIEHFERKPYGWYYAAILCTLAKLCGRGKVEVRLDGNLLDVGDIDKVIRNSQQQPNTILQSQVQYTASQTRALKDFYAEFFDEPTNATEPKALGTETKLAFQRLLDELDSFAAKQSQFPFLVALQEPINTITELLKKPYSYFLTDFKSESEQLLDWKENTIGPIRRFMAGPLKLVFETAIKFVEIHNANFADIDGDEPATLKEILHNPNCFVGDHMQRAKVLVETLTDRLETKVSEEKKTANKTLLTLKKRLANVPEYAQLTAPQQEELNAVVDKLANWLEEQTLVAVIRDRINRFEANEFRELLTRIADMSQPEPAPVGAPEQTQTAKQTESPTKATRATRNKRIEYVSARSLEVNFDKDCLLNEQDVDEYVSALRAAMLEAIKDGKRVQI